MTKFKFGDRVHIYGGILGPNFSGNGRAATVTRVSPSCLTVKSEAGEKWNVHPKQCRKIRKPKEVWIRAELFKKAEAYCTEENHGTVFVAPPQKRHGAGWIHLRQVTKKEPVK